MSVFSKVKRGVKQAVSKAQGKGNVWDMSTKENREIQVKRDYNYAKIQKAPTTERFVELDNYYNGKHYTALQIAELVAKKALTFTPPVLPDAYIQVESQIDPIVPDFQFKGRDDDLDSRNAKIRQEVVKFICYNNHLDDMNPDQERRLGKLGNAFWKVSFDGSIVGPGYIGEIVIGDPNAANIFSDPSAYDLDDCEFFDYVYRMHRRAARRKWGNILDEIANDANHGDTEIFNTETRDIFDDTVQVIEHWYRDDEGDIACSIQIGEKEVQFIPKYWVHTRKDGNKMYPFVKYCKIPNDKSFWDRSEIETIKDLIDASDREFMNAIMNDAMMSNDIILHEQDAFSEGFEPNNMPGARWSLRPTKINAVRRLGGISNNTNALNMINFIHEKIEETNGNFATKGGDPPARVNTASGLAMIREDRDSRSQPKKIDRLGGFRRLYELIDWSVLEFYNQDRIILIRGKTKDDPATTIVFNSENLRKPVKKPMSSGLDEFKINPEQETKQEQETEVQETYFPRIDCEINVGQGISKSPALTLQATQELAAIPVTPQNVELVCSMVDQMGLPEANTIKDSLRASVPPPPSPTPGTPGVQETDSSESINTFLKSIPPPVVQYILQLPEEQQPEIIQQMMAMETEELSQVIIDIMQEVGGS